MLYMVGMIGRNDKLQDKFYIKIGYTKDLDKRMKTYKTHNPLILPLYKTAGGKKLEKKYFNKLCYYLPTGVSPQGEWVEVYKREFFHFLSHGFAKIGISKQDFIIYDKKKNKYI